MAIRDADTPSVLSTLLLKYAKLLPPTAFKKGFRKWWLADGGIQTDEEKKMHVEKELRRLGGEKGSGSRGGSGGGGKEAEKKEEKVKEAKILPPPQADSVHQVLLRLHLLDAGLAYA